ncbi:MAG: IS3 family transposase [Paracoccaceae bacterium]
MPNYFPSHHGHASWSVSASVQTAGHYDLRCFIKGGYPTREAARQDVFHFIEMFYNPQRKHARNGMLSPIAFEQQQKLKRQGV